ncbi:MAG: alpha/beta hydrolase-fold protein [Chitinophagaceae bacterium]|nr:alpha/beta hydrolase-fold protein [Chitinophagaceae bacterium]
MNDKLCRSICLLVVCLLSIAGYSQNPRPKGAIGVQAPKKKSTGFIAFNTDSAYQKHEWIPQSGDTLKYRLLLPADYDSSKKYPLVLFLHGAGERGSDNQKQLIHGANLFLQPQVRENYPAIVVFPQCPENDFWSNVEMEMNDTTKKWSFNFLESGAPTQSMKMLLYWLPELEKKYKIDPLQRYVMGLSMGGMGTFEIVRRKPGYFAAAVPICGGANPKTAASIKETAFWIFHGDKDDVVPYQLSEQMVYALQEFYAGAEVNFTLYGNVGHNSWDPAFEEPDLLPWLFGQKKD